MKWAVSYEPGYALSCYTVFTNKVTQSAVTGSISRARLRNQLLQAVPHEPGYAISCYMQYITSQVTQSGATGSISRARLRTQLLQTVAHEQGYAIRCNGQYLTSKFRHSAATGSISRVRLRTQLQQAAQPDVACMSEASGSNLSCDNHPGRDLLWSFPVPSNKYEESTLKTGPRPLPHPFQFITHHRPITTLRSLTCCQHR